MLGKLLKYDLKWIFKGLMIFYILSLIFAVLGRGLVEIENSIILNIIGKICQGIAISMVINILINNLMRVWTRFVRNAYKDESYLTHTLPVGKKTIYLSKILSAIITMLVSGVVIIATIAISYYSEANIEFLRNTIEIIANSYNSTIIGFILTMFAVLVLELIFALLAGYMGIILGHKSNNMKMLKSTIYGFIGFMLPSIITLLILFIAGLFNTDIMNLFFTENVMPNIDIMKNVLYIAIGLYIMYIAIYYKISSYIFEKGVNVD